MESYSQRFAVQAYSLPLSGKPQEMSSDYSEEETRKRAYVHGLIRRDRVEHRNKPLLSEYGLTESKRAEILRQVAQAKERAHLGWRTYAAIYLALVATAWKSLGGSAIFLMALPGLVMFMWIAAIPGLTRAKPEKVDGYVALKNYEVAASKYEAAESLRAANEEQRKLDLRRRLQEESEARQREQRRRDQRHWASLDPYEFESEVAALFRSFGYEAEVTQGSGDGGIDIVLRHEGKESFVQCKRYSSKLGPAPVRELYGVMRISQAYGGFIACPGGFTTGAVQLAKETGIVLIGLKRILGMADRSWSPLSDESGGTYPSKRGAPRS